MTQIQKLTCVGFSYVSISYVLAKQCGKSSSPQELYTMTLAGSGDKALFPNFGF